MSNENDTWMPIYWGDYFKDTGHLGTIEHGAYFLLLGHYWTTGAPLPDDDYQLRNITKTSGHNWKKIRPILEKLFLVSGGFWRHKRIDEEIKSAAENREKRRERAKKAADARWAPKDAPSIPEECPSPSPSHVEDTNVSSTYTPPQADDISQAFDAYNRTAKELGLPVARALTNARKKKLKARLRSCDGLGGWETALEKVRASPGLRGGNNHGWRADLDFLLAESKFIKLMEGSYDNWKPNNNGAGDNAQGSRGQPASIATAVGRFVAARGD